MASCCPSFLPTTNRALSLPFRLFVPGSISRKRYGTRKKIGCGDAASQRVTFQSSVYTYFVLREFQTVSFEQYTEDEDRIFNALFPDTRRRQKLNDGKARGREEAIVFPRLTINLFGDFYSGRMVLPLEFFFISVRPVVDMRVVLKEHPTSNAGSSRTVSKLLTLEATRRELLGLDYQVKPSEFELCIVGSLYPEKGGRAPPRLKGQMKLSVDLAIPPSLSLMAPPVIEAFGRALLENMNDRVNNRLLDDYKQYAQQIQARLSSA